MSGLQRGAAAVGASGSLRVASNTPHLVSLGNDRLSTAVTLHPINQGRVTIGSDPTCDVYVSGPGVCSVHCRLENSHGVVTLYPLNGATWLDARPVTTPTRLSQGSMVTLGRSSYLRFNHPQEARLMKAVLPATSSPPSPPSLPLQGAPAHFQNNGDYLPLHAEQPNDSADQTDPSPYAKDNALSELDRELDMTLKEMGRQKPPVAPRKPFKDLDSDSASNSDQESLKSSNSIRAKVSKFEYYAKQQKNVGRSQFYTTHDNELSPKVFSANSLTVNTPAKDVLGGKDVPSNYAVITQDCDHNGVTKAGDRKVMMHDNDASGRNFSYTNVVLRQKTSKIEDMVKSFDVLADSFKTNFSPKSINVNQNNVHSNKPLNTDLNRVLGGRVHDMSHARLVYDDSESKFDVNVKENHRDVFRDVSVSVKSAPIEIGRRGEEPTYGRINEVPRAKYARPSPSFDREPSYAPHHVPHHEPHNVPHHAPHHEPHHAPAQPYSAPQNSSTSAQVQHNYNIQAQDERERLREQREQAESARLEEILSMCVEYERQASCGLAGAVHVTPSERRSHNKIITNGSLPRAHPHPHPHAGLPSPLHSPSFLQTPDGYYKFDTSQNRLQNNLSKSLPARNVSSYENIDLQNHSYLELQTTPEVKIRNQSSYENVVNVDELGIPIPGGKDYNKIGIPTHDISANSIGIPTDSPSRNFPITELSSPIMIRKLNESRLGNGDVKVSPISSPYENVMLSNHGSYKPKSPTTQSPRTRIKTTFAHKKLPAPQYFVFPTPPPKEDDKTNLFDFGNEIGIPYDGTNTTNNERQDLNRSNCRLESIYENQAFEDDSKSNTSDICSESSVRYKIPVTNGLNHINLNTCSENEISQNKPVSNIEHKLANIYNKEGIEKQLSLEEEIPMIDDSELTNDIECRSSQVLSDKNDDLTNITKIVDIPIDGRPDEIIDETEQSFKNINQGNSKSSSKNVDNINDPSLNNVQNNVPSESLDFINKNNNDAETEYNISIENEDEKTFEDLKKEIMADIPELERFEKDIKEPKRHDAGVVLERERKDAIISPKIESENINAMRKRYEVLKESRKKLLLEMNELKRKMSDIRCQEDDILRELEMEKALIKGEYDSEIAILNIEQKKREELQDKLRKHEAEMRDMKRRQEEQQNDARERVDIASAKVESVERAQAGQAGRAGQEGLEGAAGEGELQMARDLLDNETRLYEDLEFTHLERESEMLAHREDIQNEISTITKRIESQKNRILNLKSEASCNLSAALDDTRELHAGYVTLLNKVEDITTAVQQLEKELKPLVLRLKEHEAVVKMADDTVKRKSDEFRYTPSDDSDVSLEVKINDRSPLDQMSQSMMIDIERRDIKDLIDDSYKNGKAHDNGDADANSRFSDSPSKSSTSSKEKKGFWERNFDSLTRKRKEKKISPPKQDVMSMSLNENFLYDNEIETDCGFDKFNSLRLKKKTKDISKSNSSSKIPTFSLGKIIKKDSLKRKEDGNVNDCRNIFVKNSNKTPSDKYKTKTKSSNIPKQNDEETVKDPKANIDPESPVKILHRKSCGDEPGARVANDFSKILSDSGKIPSQDDIDRISKVTSDAPILSSESNTLGRRTLDSLMEIERKRMVMLEEQGCRVMEDEREKISELKRAKQDEAMRLWASERERAAPAPTPAPAPPPPERAPRPQDGDADASAAADDSGNCSNSAIFDESSGVLSSSIEELPREGRADSPGGGTGGSGSGGTGRGDSSRPLSDTSDLSHDNLLSGSGGGWSWGRSGGRDGCAAGAQRPLTRYLPTDEELNLREHLESAGHEVALCPHVLVDATSCRGYLHKLGAKFHTWAKRWFVFDRVSKTFVYYWDKSEKKPRGGAYFQVIEEVYLDHGNASRSPQPLATVVVQTRARRYHLLCASNQAARIWIDAIFTGAHHYTHYRS